MANDRSFAFNAALMAANRAEKALFGGIND
jgi:hypothetical protein